jgi:hypothetical protein
MLCAAVLTGANATAAFAGEATGNLGRTGKVTPVKSDFPHAHSICAFSGQNPERFLDPSDPNFKPGRTQSRARSQRKSVTSLLSRGSNRATLATATPERSPVAEENRPDLRNDSAAAQ